MSWARYKPARPFPTKHADSRRPRGDGPPRSSTPLQTSVRIASYPSHCRPMSQNVTKCHYYNGLPFVVSSPNAACFELRGCHGPNDKSQHRLPRDRRSDPLRAQCPDAFRGTGRTDRRLDSGYGFTNPVLVDGENGIIAGHGRVMVAGKLGMASVPVIELAHLSPAQKRADILADNKLAEQAGWDRELLALGLGDLRDMAVDLTSLGFEAGELDALLRAGEPDAREDDVPAIPAVPASRPGDLWIMGNHRLVCGDATDAATVARVLGGVIPHLMVTDPPYCVAYEPDWRNRAGAAETKRTGKVLNDHRADWREAWALFPGDVADVWHGALHATTVAESLVATGFAIRSQIIWAKERLVLSRGIIAGSMNRPGMPCAPPARAIGPAIASRRRCGTSPVAIRMRQPSTAPRSRSNACCWPALTPRGRNRSLGCRIL